ncbi:heterokaryon incompatibility protein [Rutstroemia sp. NJR-2017a WRK4]|nr:heterokaryon incompatibility protein [Rutstroemia sp. NJR-2017a WRK4]
MLFSGAPQKLRSAQRESIKARMEVLCRKPHSRLKLLLLKASALSKSLVHRVNPRKTLCTKCQTLTFTALRRVEGFVHNLPEQIIAAARAGCPFCTLLEENFDLGPKSLPVKLYGLRRNLPSSDTLFIGEEIDVEAIRVVNGYDRDIDNPFAHRLALWTHQGALTCIDDPAATSVRRRPFIKDFASDECSKLVKSWLDACIFRHQACTTPIVSKLPTRVIDVGMRDGAEPTLFVSAPEFKSSYIALSYCWGSGGKRFILTKEMSEVPNLVLHMESLPNTLRDAVKITRQLGFRFLWIDALCIIQEGDNGEDFQRESVTMHRVYGDATLTLAVAASGNVNEGIYRQLSWECDSIIINSNGPLNPVTNHNKDSPGRYSDYVVRTQGPSGGVRLSETETYMAYWRRSVEFYSMRMFTNDSDKLRAISGCAQWIKAKTNDVYLAGLWESDLRTQLFWYSDDRESSSQSPLAYRAPSWSWASVNGRVKFLRPTQFTGERVNKSFTAELNVQRVDMEYRGGAGEFGDVVHGHLFISGVLRTWVMFDGDEVASKASMEKGGIFR